MALKGTLKDFGTADIFQLIGVQQKTGILKLRDNERAVNVFFLNGKIVGAESTIREKKEHLGEMLIRANIINKQQLTKALTRQRETLQRIGDILLGYNMISVEDLREMIHLQITETIYGLFRWKKGNYEFVQQKVEYDKNHVEPISAEQILMDGFRMLDEWPKVKRTIKSFDLVFQRVPGVENKVVFGDEDESSLNDKIDEAFTIFEGDQKKKLKSELRKLDKYEKRVFEFVDGKRNVQQIINLSRLGEFETCKILLGFVDEKLIEIAESERRGVEEKIKYNVIEALVNIFFVFLFIFAFFTITATTNITDLTNLSADYFFVIKKGNALKEVKSLRKIDKLENGLYLYYLRNKRYPQNLEALIYENLIKDSSIIDPWGRNYLYKTTGDSFSLKKPERNVWVTK